MSSALSAIPGCTKSRADAVSASASAAAQLRDYLVRADLTGGNGQERFFTTGYPAVFTRAAVRLLGRPLGRPVESVPVWPVTGETARSFP